MYLIHTTDENYILKILKDGYLRSSKWTKNVRMYGWEEGSKYIYLRLDKRGDYGNLVLDDNLLLENNFYLNTGWNVEPKEKEKIKGIDLTEKSLKRILEKFNKSVDNFIKERKKQLGYVLCMTNEILLTKKINLKKYLKKIKISKYNKEIVDYCKKNYPDVVVNY